MSYAIIGFGNIGKALAKAFARKGIDVSVATTRDPESFAADAAAFGPTIIPKKLADAVKADIIFLAVRFESHPDVAKALATWQGKTIVDVTNAYGVPPEKLGDSRLPSSSHRHFLVQNWSRASTIWSLPSLIRIRPYIVAEESYFWRATMTLPQRRLLRSRKSSVSRRSNLAGFRKVGCWSMRAEIAGVS